MKNIFFIACLALFALFLESCASEREFMAYLPKIGGFEIKKIYRLNSNYLAKYTDYSGNLLVFKFNESSSTWKRLLFKTKLSSKD